ncbi:hypothetical protein GGR57DRAFT_451831 [Xylariaceae sp. FL1272]|nr:hypothetical protein GGR57DRAFT_451831 [Xylariaceae sp. FL1272]
MPTRTKELYFLLPESLPTHHVRPILGRVVSSDCVSRPTDNYAPDMNELDLRSIVPNIYERPVEFKDVQKVIKSAKDNDLRLAVIKLVESYWKSRDNHGTSITAPVFRRYRMTRIPQKFQQLMKNKRYANEVKEMMSRLQGGQMLYLVTGLLSCTDYTIQSTNGKDVANGFGLNLPSEALAVTGAPPLGGTEITVDTGKATGHEAHGTAQGELAIAIAYHILLSEKGRRRPFSWSWWRSIMPWGSRGVLHPVPVVGKPVKGDLEGFLGHQSSIAEQGAQEARISQSSDTRELGDDAASDFELRLSE